MTGPSGGTGTSGEQVLSTVPAFLAMVGDREAGDVTAARWHDEYEAHHSEVFATYYSAGETRRDDRPPPTGRGR